MAIAIEQIREQFIEVEFVGFSPSTRSVKPVHIANGLFRVTLDKIHNTKFLNQFVFWQQANGKIPKGHDLPTIYNGLREKDLIDPSSVDKRAIERLRIISKKILSADDGVFLYKDNMDSYSAAFESFVSKDRIGQSGGELIAQWLRTKSSPLIETIENDLHNSHDILTTLFKPLLVNDEDEAPKRIDFDKVRFIHGVLPEPASNLWNGLLEAAVTLNEHLEQHPNKLLRLRLSVLFACFVLIRHLSSLEACYVPGAEHKILPFLLDFSASASEPVAQASLMTYIYVCQSISRFYAWAFGQYLQSQYVNPLDLRDEELRYKSKSSTKLEGSQGAFQKGVLEIWQLAFEEIDGSDQPFTVLGQALYDILAQEAEGNPIVYLRQLGNRSGLLWPPINTQPTKRFLVQQDTLEMLIRGAVRPGEIVDLPTLQRRFWERYRIVIGGRNEDEQYLTDFGVYQADSNALVENQKRFADRLSSLDFAHMLADGVLKVKL